VRIAIQDSFPNLPISAEREFIRRAIVAFGHLGHEAIKVETSDDILAFSPDLVLVTHEFTPKLVDVPTVGLMWSPTPFFEEDPYRLRNVLSYDGYFSGSPAITVFVRDLLFAVGKTAPVAEFMYPSCFDTRFQRRSLDSFSLFYAGVNWDGRGFGKLFGILDKEAPLRVYGPRESWRFLKRSYAGAVPADGTSLLDRISECGVALCLHRPEHRQMGVPSARIFEAAAAGAVIMGEDFSFTREHFGDAMLYLDPSASHQELAEQIKLHLKWLADHPEEALAMAERSHAIFSEKFCLEQLFRDIESLAQEVRRQSFYCPVQPDESNDLAQPLVEYIVRAGTRPIKFVDRALGSLANQTYSNIGIILVLCGKVEELDALIQRYKLLFRSFRIVEVGGHPGGGRSAALWAGLRAVTAPLFGNLDDDDEVHVNHVAALVAALTQDASSLVAYSGVVRVEEDDGFYFVEPNFDGPEKRVIKERRRLQFLDAFDRKTLMDLSGNYIQSNTWLAKRDVLDERILTDPCLHVCEDVYLYLCFLTKTSFVSTWRGSAVWNWRSMTKDNFGSQPEQRREAQRRIKNRFSLEMHSSRLLQMRPTLARDRSFYEIDPSSRTSSSHKALALMRKGVTVLRAEGFRALVLNVVNRIQRFAQTP